MKKVLMVAYHYHPDLSVGVLRTSKFAKYMPEFGWTPVILTVHPKHYTTLDPAAPKSDAVVYRTGKLPTPDDFIKLVMRLVRGRPTETTQGTEKGGAPIVRDGFHRAAVPLWKRTLNSLSRIPDENMGWLIPGTFKAIRLAAGGDIAAVYTSGPPYTCHVIGLLTSLATGKPLLADFRDPWSLARKPPEVETAFSRWLARFLEKRVVMRADKVVTSTPELTELFGKMFPEKKSDSMVTIMNGFDDQDFSETEKKNLDPRRPITFLYAGNLYHGRDPYVMLTALGELIREKRIGRNEVRVVFQGIITVDTTNIRKAIADYQLGDLVQFNQPVGRDSYFKLIIEADILILVQAPQQAAMIPAKTFEYLASGNEILALLPEGAAARFLTGFENVAIADIFDKEKIKEGILKLIDRIRSGARVDNRKDERLLSVSRRRLTGKLCGLLDEITGSARR